MMRRPGLLLFGLMMVLGPLSGLAQPGNDFARPMPPGDATRGRLIFAPCRTCHYTQSAMGHHNGPNLHRVFGKVVGKQQDFAHYSAQFKGADFIWTPQLMYVWLENPRKMFPGSSMMSLGVPDAQQRADLIAYLTLASVRLPEDDADLKSNM